MEFTANLNQNKIGDIISLIKANNLSKAEDILRNSSENSPVWFYLNSKVNLAKSWFDAAKINLEKALSLNPKDEFLQSEYMHLMSRHRGYSDDYYRGGYRRNRGCGCCCCDDCCHISCCDLICLDQCCECMGGDLISCI